MSSVPAPPPSKASGEPLAGRYELLRRLGEGAVGAVFLARDRETGEQLALKQLSRIDPRSVARFKREFRLLADLHHPNCVKLYDLQHAPDAWFLTMEYVDGRDLERTLTRPFRETRESQMALQTVQDGVPDAKHLARIAHAFCQLARGVHAVHEAGMLHRDLKPSNVVIERSGRVVVLDFGLVRGLGAPQNDVTLEGTVAGTPAYMPPEQALGETLSEASDWYAFGAMLYEALSGHLPIEGASAQQLIQRKLAQRPAPLGRDVAPRALAQLCAALLEREPAARPGAQEILAVLAQLDRGTQPEITITEERNLPPMASVQAPFFGRQAELEQLHAALSRSRSARSTVVAHVHGTSGSGKTSLIEHFLAELQERSGAPFVLRSRCYEREAMPFKALDSVLDALVWHMLQLDDLEVAHLLPAEVAPLAQLFPALERLRPVQRLLVSRGKPQADAAHLRRRAELGLRELLANVAQRHGLVLWIDDLQWGDLDSANLLHDWLLRPFDSPVLLLLSYRSEEIGTSPCLGVLLADPPLTAATPAIRFDLALSQLRDVDVQALCERRLAGSGALAATCVARIVREAQGNAFLASQLLALAQAKLARGELDLEALSVNELVQRTTALLSAPARELLSVLAVAGRPLGSQLALGAANARQDGRAHIHALQGLRLVRTRNVGETRLLEVYHDRVREAVLESLSLPERELIHDRLLRNADASGRADPGWLHELAMGAGQRLLALRHGLMAAELASASLAFERAAELYARCANLAEAKADLAQIWSKLGAAQARCRRGVAAAEAYLRASELSDEQEQLPFLQLAASHLLRSGRYAEGEQLVMKLLSALDIQLPSTRFGMYAAIGWEMARIRWLLRGLQPRAGVQLPKGELRRAEYCGILAVETQSYAPLRAALLQTRTLRTAFQYGEIETTARALALSATLQSLRGTSEAGQEAHAQLDWADRLSVELEQPQLRLELLSARAVCGLSLGDMQDVIDASSAANAFYETKSAGGQQGDYYYMFAVRAVRIAALQNLGRHAVAAAELRELRALAEATSNRAAMLQATLITTTVEQAEAQCAGSRARLEHEREELPTSGTGLLHVLHMTSVLRAASLTAEHDWALAELERFWPGFRESPVRRSAYLTYILHSARARLRLNHAFAAGSAGDPERLIREDRSVLQRQAPTPYRIPATARLSARVALLRGDVALASESLQQSAAAHEQVGAQDEAARERFALGVLQGGKQGESLQRTALEVLQGLGIARPLLDLRAYYPELLSRG